jgi:ATP-dependent Zn protease
MVTRWGMSERLGLVQFAPRENPYLSGANGCADARPFSEATAEAIDAEVLKRFCRKFAFSRVLVSVTDIEQVLHETKPVILC